jgi:hypothetical protein
MNVALFCIGILAGICAWGFLLAGALTFHDPDRPEIRGWGFLLFLVKGSPIRARRNRKTLSIPVFFIRFSLRL